MKLNKKLKKQIISDIDFCNSFKTKIGTKEAYDILTKKYDEIDENFSSKIPVSGKAYVPGNEPNYLPEIRAIAAKLETYLSLGKITDGHENSKNRKNKIIVAIIAAIATILAAIAGSLVSILLA